MKIIEQFTDPAKKVRVLVETTPGECVMLKYDHEPTTAEVQAELDKQDAARLTQAQAELAAVDTQVATLQASKPVLQAKVQEISAELTAKADAKSAPIEEPLEAVR